jgi:signal transduction histidine kinase
MTERKKRLLEHLPAAFKLVLSVLLLSLGILGWLLLQQDDRLQQERYQERVGLAADRLTQALERRVISIRGRLEKMTVDLVQSTDELPADLNAHRGPWVAIHLSHDRLEAQPPESLHYVPPGYEHKTSRAPWAEADRLEFADRDPAGAQLLLETMLSSANADERAGTLARLGRIRQRLGDIPGSLAAYAELAKMTGHYVEAVPATWLAHYARCALWENEQDSAMFANELVKLMGMLRKGGYPVSRATYTFYARASNEWSKSISPLAEPLPLDWPVSDALSALSFSYSEWQNGLGEPSGFSIIGDAPKRQALLWRTVQSSFLGIVVPLEKLAGETVSELREALSDNGIGWQINDGTGSELISGGGPASGVQTSQTLDFGNTTLVVNAYQTQAMLPQPVDQMRRQLLLWGLFLALIMVIAGTYFLARTLRREAEIAALQVEFVSAVSHEFRTPLTSIRQLTELLGSGRIRDAEKVSEYYRVLDRESARLQRMVEDLLDFGRMEANAKPYRPERLDLPQLMQEVIAEFSTERRLASGAIRLQSVEPIAVTIDRESLVRALWNLLDNAVKYSAIEPDITVRIFRSGGLAKLEVSDRGVGIEEADRERIFDKFVRGTAAARTRARGTGLGLAMVRQILADQGGTIEVSGANGTGATFTITLNMTEKS